MPAVALAVFACKACNRALGIMSADMIHQNIRNLRRIFFDNAHYGIDKRVRICEFDKIQDRVGKRIIHNGIKLFAEEIAPSFAVSKFCCGILPNLADNNCVAVFVLNSTAQIVEKNIGQLIGNIKPPA